MSAIKKIIPSGVRQMIRSKILGVDINTYFYSQAGEDAILYAIFKYVIRKEKGFYVDVGAYHPKKASNTLLLYREGWQGINIEPNPELIREFFKHRKRDINLQIGISASASQSKYYMLKSIPSMNTFSYENLERLGLKNEISGILQLETIPLGEVFTRHIPGQEIDLLNIDTEGYEMEVLSSNDWDRFNPKVISVEQNELQTLEDVLHSEVNSFLEKKGYVAVAKNFVIKDVATVFYIKRDFLEQ